jgi:TatD DNase family protein
MWGVGCHPRKQKAQDEFNAASFASMVARSALVGEVGLDTGSRVPMRQQVRVFRQILEMVAETPRVLSIHSYRATALVLKELARTPVATPILHWWTGSVAETREAVALGCYFSVHSAVARHSKFRTAIPAERLLVESDHGWSDPPAAIPCRIEWVEFLLSASLGRPREDIRRLAWDNFSTILIQTRVEKSAPAEILALSASAHPRGSRPQPL